MPNPFHLSYFLQGSSVHAWGAPFIGTIGQDWQSASFFKELAQGLERACFDYLLIEDSIYVGENWQGSRDLFLKTGLCIPRQEPSVVATLLAADTSRLGIVPTLSTFAYHPYLTARITGTLDQISGGRAGWNMVTGSSDFAAQNFGMPAMPEHDQRYVMAEEYAQIVKGLWGSWAPGAQVGGLVPGEDQGQLFDPAKVNTIDFQGEYYASRGPLNSGPTVQERPVIAQAGGSKMGIEFAARHADTIVAAPHGAENMRAYRDQVRAQMVQNGRDPDSCKVLFLISPIVEETEEMARWKADQRRIEAEQNMDMRLARLGWTINIDFSEFDLDQPVGELTTNGHQSSLKQFLERAGARTLREAVLDTASKGYGVDLVGTPDSVAAQMEEVMQTAGGDGFLITLGDLSRRSLAGITDGLVPALQRRGLVRKNYEHATLRDNLLAF
ncbi:NtaA/DmoA family FMN-dependent monooxygenase [Salipiger sp. 1_MG-2023]|uniref:NtaA/DmoA family FMN-dependent monooxygenase n=1 Tax=Salipiger sp. 1_MG-2023 TaxID=3062665 RepID=UPI0026E12583|nr:NtaA/DmoA family FMN-dependent monooxygenase [Salipiger sp. 1_MG-2023]MDO6585055.1 NtaA/DmoA family FMN-dependent monooxygenase [Salipiger sp. 1_MG-2023]